MRAPYNSSMNGLFAPLAVLGAAVACLSAPAQAADSPAQVTAKLATALEQEIAILAGIGNAEQAQAAVEPLRKSLAEQQALFGADDKELWDYISNTQGTETRLVELLEQLSHQFTRMDEAQFYDCAALRELLAPQMVTAD